MSCLTLCSLSAIVSNLALADLSSTGAFVITSNSAERGARAITCVSQTLLEGREWPTKLLWHDKYNVHPLGKARMQRGMNNVPSGSHNITATQEDCFLSMRKQ
jgi:hypothetical protein